MQRRFTFVNGCVSILALLCFGLPHHASAQILPPPTNLPPVVRITSPPNQAVFFAPVNIPIFAFARDLSSSFVYSNNTVTNVEFFAGGMDLGHGHKLLSQPSPIRPLYILPVAEWVLVWSNAPVGAFPLTAVATDSRGRSGTSAPVNITILPSPPPPTNRPPIVSIVASDPIAIEGTNCWVWRGLTNATPTWADWPVAGWRFFTNCGPKSATFTVRRFGDTNGSLTVSYAIGGTATNGVDYMTLPGSVTIPAGDCSALITVVPKDDGPPDITSTVVLTLNPSPALPPDYLLGFPRRAAAIIVDSGRPFPVTAMVPDKCFHLNSTGPDGAWFCVQYTTDLLNWQPICTNQVVNGSVDFVDPDASNDSRRFYRAVPQNGAP
jgi:hypothetical protein